jgi:hypothetical protein
VSGGIEALLTPAVILSESGFSLGLAGIELRSDTCGGELDAIQRELLRLTKT